MIKALKAAARAALGIRSETLFYSQAGEDAIVWKVASEVLKIESGIYVDVGAFHPYKHSNTYLLYKAGWHGLNIDPRPGTKKLFEKYRPKDTSLEVGVGGRNSEMDYHILSSNSTMNSFSIDNLKRLGVEGQITKTVRVPVYRLDHILSLHPEYSAIDYLNIDAEGLELEILTSLDYERNRPKIISIEQNQVFTLADIMVSDVCGFLRSVDFTPVAKNILLKDVSTVFYVCERRLARN